MSTEGPIGTENGDGGYADNQPLVAGRYRVLQRLDRPGGALATSARDESNGQIVTIDFLDMGPITPEALENVRAKVRQVATASSPGLVPTVDLVEYRDTVGIVSETVEGVSLATMLRTGPLSVGQAATIGRTLSGELARLHAVGAHHGTLTPNSVVIDGDGETHLLGSAAGFLGASIGQPSTTPYAAPEQLTEHAEGAPADLYALGVLLYEMVVGTPPIANWDDTVVAERKVHDDPLPPSAVATLVPKEYDQLVLQLLDPRPVARPSAAEAEAALRRLEVPVLDRTVRPAAAVIIEPAAEPRRSIWPALALAAVVGILATLLIVWLVQDDNTEPRVVPTVVGQTQAQATAALQNAGFEVSAVTAPNNGVALGVVSEQSPLGGTKADDNATVAITVSSGPLAPAATPPPIIITPSSPTNPSSSSTSTTTTTTTSTTPPPT